MIRGEGQIPCTDFLRIYSFMLVFFEKWNIIWLEAANCILPVSGTHDARCCCERLSLCTGDGKALGDLFAPGESVRIGGKNSRRGATGQILGDSGRRGQTGKAQIRAQAERNV